MTKKINRITVFALVIVGALLAAAVVYGVLNALIGKGEWSFGWKDYRYDESGYEVGQGSIRVQGITAIEVDWIDGEVEIVSCGDTYPSITETSPNTLSKAAEVRWTVDESGTLRVKYRKSAWLFGMSSQNRNKKLVLRIPENLFETLASVKVNAVSSNVTVRGVMGESLSIVTESGSVGLEGAVFEDVKIETKSGDVGSEAAICQDLRVQSRSGGVYMKLAECPKSADLQTQKGHTALYLPEESSFTLYYTTESGRFTNDFGLDESDRNPDGGYICGSGENTLRITTTQGNCVMGVVEKEKKDK